MEIIGLTLVSDDSVSVLARKNLTVSEFRFDRLATSPIRLNKFDQPAQSLQKFADWIGAWDPDTFIFREPIQIASPTFDKIIAALPPALITVWRGTNAA